MAVVVDSDNTLRDKAARLIASIAEDPSTSRAPIFAQLSALCEGGLLIGRTVFSVWGTSPIQYGRVIAATHEGFNLDISAEGSRRWGATFHVGWAAQVICSDGMIIIHQQEFPGQCLMFSPLEDASSAEGSADAASSSS